MGRSRRKKKGSGCFGVVFTLFFILVIAAGGVLGYLYVNRYKPSTEAADKRKIFGVTGSQVALLLDNELSEEKGIYEDGQVYLPIDWVNDKLNQRFYWDEGENMLVYALPESILYADEDSKGENGALLKVKEDGVYLSLGLVANYTDIRVDSYDSGEIKRVFIYKKWEPEEQAIVKRKGMIRERGGIKSDIITQAWKGDTVTVLDTMENWSEVRTADGYIGYIENKKLEETEPFLPVSSFEEPVYTSRLLEEKVRLGFHQVTKKEANKTLESLASNAEGMNVIVPTWYNVVSSDGSYNSLADKDYVIKAHELGLEVWAMVENVSTEESVKELDTKELMSSTTRRKKLIENLMKEADTYGFDGFNLDFEGLKSEAGPHYVQFIREMSVACRKKGLVLSVDDYVPAAYSAFYNRREQGIVADYVIVLGYDEHYAGGEAGSVASISYVKEGIVNTLEEVPKEKLINAVPFYTRVWTTDGDKTTSRAYGIADAETWVKENEVSLSWDDITGQYYGEKMTDKGLSAIWMEEERSLGLKIDLVNEYDLAGVACWKLGFEPADIWEVIDRVK